jgi:hypothetical protein
MVRSAPPLAKTMPAYITCIICIKQVNPLRFNLTMRKSEMSSRESGRNLQSLPNSVEMKQSRTNHHGELHIHQPLPRVPLVSPNQPT